MIHSVVSSRSASSEKLSLPSIDRPSSGGGLTSSTTSLSLLIVGLSPATGTLWFGQVAGSDQRVGWAAWAFASGAPWKANMMTRPDVASSGATQNERYRPLMA